MFTSSAAAPADRLEIVANLRTALASVMTVTGYEFQNNGVIRLWGILLAPPDQAYRALRPRVEQMGYTPFLREYKDGASGHAGHEVLAVPGVVPRPSSNPTLNLILFVATVGSVILSGSVFSQTGQLDLGAGLAFAGSLLGVLVTHEMGHYLVGRLRGAPVSLPYFIPMPSILFGMFGFGTLGAVIVQREPFEDRRTLLEVGLAGPLAGFIVAVPLLAIGLALSTVKPFETPALGGAIYFGDSLLTGLIKVFVYGRYVPSAGMIEHPLYLGAWLGLLITGINLIPAGQLDGGHVAYAVLGQAARYLYYAMLVIFLGLTVFVSQSWLLWTVLLFLFGRNHPPALNQAARLEPQHYALALIGCLVLLLVFMPNPLWVA
ncbi:MAG: site-2 protease family protein [Anaerolineae bacterium]|nr:site-2 protease family protein [Thermoflexales bacterium]MDW8406916.1 site-2 protease family protein [Anaerolineae bacterium]